MTPSEMEPEKGSTFEKMPSGAGGLDRDEDEDDPNALNSLSKFTLFETKSRFYITASTANSHRVLKIDRTDPTALNVTEDGTTYDDAQLDLLLRMVQDGNKSQGGLEKVMEFHGIVGFVRFTAGWYIILITKRSVVGLLGGHYIYHCDETSLITVGGKSERSSQELKMMSTFQQVDLSKNFYFSYSYDITNTLQTNLTTPAHERPWNTRFMWNYRLLKPAFTLEEPKGRSKWVLPLIHGFVDQAKINVFARTVYLTLVARRSRHFAGARFLTRGANENGHVANEVETEQIVSEPLATPFGLPQSDSSPSEWAAGYGGYTSVVQYRGSIPVMWHQESNQMTPRPPIEITIKDPFYTPAARHFNDLLARYSGPIYILNLIKSRETVPREMKLLSEYGHCVEYLNQFLPEGGKMKYIAWDMSQAAKRGDQDVMGVLEDICEEALGATDFFHGGAARNESPSEPRRTKPLLQHGILRVNCVDCLDRTNAAQFAIAKRSLGHQLFALGLLSSPYLPFSCDAVDVLTEMYHDHGDTWQYTGSALVNRVDTYRRTKAAQWSSHSRDLLENIRRFYNNSLLDADKQAAINLFLGVEPSMPIAHINEKPRYRQWYDPENLVRRDVQVLTGRDRVYKEYYKPHILSQFQRLYAFTMNSTARFHSKSRPDNISSPFESRIADINSTMAHVSSLKRSAKRWASQGTSKDQGGASSKTDGGLDIGASSPSTSPDIDPATATAITSVPSHPIEALISSLYYPPETDVRAKASEYEWYIHYPSDPASHALEMADEKDLELYVRQSRLSGADDGDVERLLIPDAANWVGAAEEVARRERERERENEREKERNLGMTTSVPSGMMTATNTALYTKDADSLGTALPALGMGTYGHGHGPREKSGDSREVGVYEAWLRGV